jgi:ABC-2 type transport system permease protein
MAPLFAGYFAGLFYVPINPDAPLSVALSLFPITAPLTMPARVVAGGASPLEVALAMAGTVAAIGGIVWLASRIYMGAILQTQRVNLLSAFRRAGE